MGLYKKNLGHLKNTKGRLNSFLSHRLKTQYNFFTTYHVHAKYILSSIQAFGETFFAAAKDVKTFLKDFDDFQNITVLEYPNPNYFGILEDLERKLKELENAGENIKTELNKNKWDSVLAGQDFLSPDFQSYSDLTSRFTNLLTSWEVVPGMLIQIAQQLGEISGKTVVLKKDMALKEKGGSKERFRKGDEFEINGIVHDGGNSYIELSDGGFEYLVPILLFSENFKDSEN